MCRLAWLVVILLSVPHGGMAAEETHFSTATKLLERHCLDCHGDEPSSGIELSPLLEPDSFAAEFETWQRVKRQLRDGLMPPADADPLPRDDRRQLSESIRAGVRAAAQRYAGDPGPVVMRRLTSSEYEHTINDLTGLELPLRRGFVDDAVGGTGFTNTATGQFVQDSTLEHYLATAKRVARHASIGTGPLAFHESPGRTGLELSAITRIQSIYEKHGFRSASGEGGEAFGLDKYPRALFAAWRYEHRADRDETLREMARELGVDERFVAYVHRVMTSGVTSFPLSEVVEPWRRLPEFDPDDADQSRRVLARCHEIAAVLRKWQNRFGSNPDAKEEAPVLRADLFEVDRTQPFEMNVNWPEGTRTAHVVLTVESATGLGAPDVVVVWRNPELFFRLPDRVERDQEPLAGLLGKKSVELLGFGRHPRGGKVGPGDFVTTGVEPVEFELPIPEGARSARLFVTAELDVKTGASGVVRGSIAQREETDQGKSVSGLLADPKSPSFREWRAGVIEFARTLPQVSQREPAPSDRDPIPEPFDTSYNNPVRNAFHTRIKYHRDDRFLVENVLDDATRRELDLAWADLLGSFDYHDQWLQLLAKSEGVDLGGRTIDSLEESWIATVPPEPRAHVRRLRDEYAAVRQRFAAAAPGHIDDVLEFTARAWRRPLDDGERLRLRGWYEELRAEHRRSHEEAIRSLIARVLVAPEFLYRAERGTGETVSPLSDWELASRLSYFLWSSAPDERLRELAKAGELSRTETLVAECRRMLDDPRSKRFAAEFFGQWFGFYRFDESRGIDAERFPEFDDDLKAALHEEAVTFFDHVVRHDRPVDEILQADYTFLDRRLARHYGVPDDLPETEFHRVEGHRRGGLLRLGAVLAVTSAPLRTSPVKRGDWVLRRVLGTPVPPPPADAGSIAADDVAADGLTVRTRLEAHRREASCANCHSRIDPLGFALEHYDPLGRWRNGYRDGQPIDASGVLRDGTEINDFDGLKRHLRTRRSDFHETLSKRLLTYALGRSDLVGDLPLLERMNGHTAKDGGVRELVELIVTSRQFRYHAASRFSDEGDP